VKPCLLIIAGGLALLAGGCDLSPTPPEQSAAYQQAQKLREANDYRAAAQSYQQLLDDHPRFARGHLEWGLLCDEKLGDPIGAIYHYRRYLELEPSADKRRVVEDFIERAKLSLAAKLPQPAGVDTSELLRLQAQNAALAAELAALKTKPSEFSEAATSGVARVAAPPPPPATAAASAVPETPKPRVHVVQKGDTLYSLAVRYYNDRTAWKKIYEANRAALSNKDQLRIGQSLVIP
jgi:tetratricopeptide (TPR) repeat protein